MTYKDKLKKIFQYHGLSTQLKKLSEEVFELQEAVIKFSYVELHEGTPAYSYLKGKIEEEFADVMVILNQIMLAYNLNEADTVRWQKYKIDRQCIKDGLDGNS